MGAAADMDVPKEYKWVNDCEWEETDYTKYAHFNKIEKFNKSRDACLLIHAHMFAVADLDTSLSLDRCEWSYACVAMTVKEDASDDEAFEAGKKCAKMATTTSMPRRESPSQTLEWPAPSNS